MNWQKIKTSNDNTYFTLDGKSIFDKKFIEVLKFHSPGIAPVKDESGAYHIDAQGKSIYNDRYERTFGFYCNRAVVTIGKKWFHIGINGERISSQNYAWCGNFQENLCTVRDYDNNYFHIDLNGNKIYENKYIYCGDFKDNYACVKQQNGLFKHINQDGKFINDKEFLELGVYHKNFATAKDKNGWFHIALNGEGVYIKRFANIEPFYNGQAKVESLDGNSLIIDETGKTILAIGQESEG